GKRAHGERADRDRPAREGDRRIRADRPGAVRVSMYVIRDVQRSDLPGLQKLARELDTVNLPNDERQLSHLIDLSARSFASKLRDPFQREYLFVLEDLQRDRVVGSSLVISQHGTR